MPKHSLRNNFQKAEWNRWGNTDFYSQTPSPFWHILCFLLPKSPWPIFLSNPISSCVILCYRTFWYRQAVPAHKTVPSTLIRMEAAWKITEVSPVWKQVCYTDRPHREDTYNHLCLSLSAKPHKSIWFVYSGIKYVFLYRSRYGGSITFDLGVLQEQLVRCNKRNHLEDIAAFPDPASFECLGAN